VPIYRTRQQRSAPRSGCRAGTAVVLEAARWSYCTVAVLAIGLPAFASAAAGGTTIPCHSSV